ncbi:hypothetical protein JCM10207_006915 [Rhodosporidiobolus poonsookiae]
MHTLQARAQLDEGTTTSICLATIIPGLTLLIGLVCWIRFRKSRDAGLPTTASETESTMNVPWLRRTRTLAAFSSPSPSLADQKGKSPVRQLGQQINVSVVTITTLAGEEDSHAPAAEPEANVRRSSVSDRADERRIE